MSTTLTNAQRSEFQKFARLFDNLGFATKESVNAELHQPVISGQRAKHSARCKRHMMHVFMREELFEFNARADRYELTAHGLRVRRGEA